MNNNGKMSNNIFDREHTTPEDLERFRENYITAVSVSTDAGLLSVWFLASIGAPLNWAPKIMSLVVAALILSWPWIGRKIHAKIKRWLAEKKCIGRAIMFWSFVLTFKLIVLIFSIRSVVERVENDVISVWPVFLLYCTALFALYLFTKKKGYFDEPPSDIE